jgi:hypothetical protein
MVARFKAFRVSQEKPCYEGLLGGCDGEGEEGGKE